MLTFIYTYSKYNFLLIQFFTSYSLSNWSIRICEANVSHYDYGFIRLFLYSHKFLYYIFYWFQQFKIFLFTYVLALSSTLSDINTAIFLFGWFEFE